MDFLYRDFVMSKEVISPKPLEILKQVVVYTGIFIVSVAVGFFGTWGVTSVKQIIRQSTASQKS